MNGINARGTTLVELLIAMVIGLFLMGAIGSVYIASKDTNRTTDILGRLQENGRIAMQMITEDLQMAGYLGNSKNPALVARRAGAPNAIAPIGNDCAPNWFTDMGSLLVVGNEQVPAVGGVSFDDTGRCMSTANYQNFTDVIAVKRAANGQIPATAGAIDNITPHTNWLLLRTDAMRGEFFVGGVDTEPTGFTPAFTTNRRWLAHVYYIDYNAGALLPEDRMPMLRRVRLGSGPAFFNNLELVRGVQDMQIQFGIDTDGDGNANSFVEPGNEGLSPVVAARVWLLMRAEEREVDYNDSVNTYVYANKQYVPNTSGNGTETAQNPQQFRRLLLTKTIALRNTWQ